MSTQTATSQPDANPQFLAGEHIGTQIVDAILALLSPGHQPNRPIPPCMRHIEALAASAAELLNETGKPAPDANAIRTLLARHPGDTFHAYTRCITALLDNRHPSIASEILDSAPAPGNSQPRTLLAHLFALLRTGKLSTGMSKFQEWNSRLGNCPDKLPILAAFQFGLWQITEALDTFSLPGFPITASPDLPTTRLLLRTLAGQAVSTAEIDTIAALHNVTLNTRLNLATLYRETGAHDRALEIFEQHPDHLFATLNRASTLSQLGRTNDAQNLLAPLGLTPASIATNQFPASAAMQELSTRVTASYGPASTLPYFHPLTQFTVARTVFPVMPARELASEWFRAFAATWRQHPEGNHIPAQPFTAEEPR